MRPQLPKTPCFNLSETKLKYVSLENLGPFASKLSRTFCCHVTPKMTIIAAFLGNEKTTTNTYRPIPYSRIQRLAEL